MRHIIEKKLGALLAIDADPNSALPESLGVKRQETVAGIIEDVSKHMDKIPAGMTKDRFLTMRVQEAVVEEDGFDLLVMGRPEGPGCYCYVNNLLREITTKVTKNYAYTVIDNAAGMEHISRRTARAIDRLVLVSDYSVMGVRSVKRIYDLARELEIKIGSTFLIINKVDGPIALLDKEIKDTALKMAGALPYDKDIHDASVKDAPIFVLKSKSLETIAEAIFNTIIKG